MKQEGLYQNKVNSRLASIHNCKMAYSKLKSKTILIAGLPRAQSARGTEPYTHGIWSTSFCLVVT